jgi:hypothetical protein
MDRFDVIYGCSIQPEYRMTFIPPTKEQVRAEKWHNIKENIKTFIFYLFMFLIWICAGAPIITLGIYPQ